jgi:hypothetical protein
VSAKFGYLFAMMLQQLPLFFAILAAGNICFSPGNFLGTIKISRASNI